MKKQNIKILPSPYKAVKEYEDEFVKVGMDFISGQVKHTLNFIKNNINKNSKK